MSIKPPQEIKKELDKKAIGQDHAKKILSIEIFKHYLKIQNQENLKEMNKEIKKNNILMTGSTGTGKTYLAQTIAEILDVPFAIVDATTLTQAGYVGEDVENILLKLMQNADYDIARAEKGIVYIDEIDKIARKSENPSITRDVSGEGVQQALLKILEGTVAAVPPQGGRKHPNQECLKINTKDILFIAGGSFEGIEDIVNKRIGSKNDKNIGFTPIMNDIKSKKFTSDEIRNNITFQDLKKFGLMPELLGRFTAITNLQSLKLDDLVKILKLKDGVIKEYETIFQLQNKKLKFKKETLEKIAEIALINKTGARGLRNIVERIMEDFMFNAPSENKLRYIVDLNNIKAIYKNYFKNEKLKEKIA
ncbi:ATP-dependent Clp protease ATP-binding subunit ClpX [Clostridium botulinum]|uniref:ATP-dependent Clp protease ATP-binding subunit ClpX n=1 Tax=Clostridium botulinum TaxID=1491 RepID=UPI00220F787E|nr:ATP-dependent Clp protease ATP-binding subunit ClpX [Clostridium botulinum]QDY27036.1 ATP-dependent protease ATP-binding subunit ClpX [Clostridium botulinum]